MPVVQYNELIAAQEAAKTGAQEAAKYPYNIQTNIPGPNGPISGLASDIYGTPGTKQATPQGTLPPQLDPRAKFSAAEKMRILQDITGEKPIEQVAGQTNVVQGRDPIDVTKAESQIKLGSELTGKTADVYLNTIKTDMPGVRQAVSQAIPLNHMALSMLDSGKVLTGKGANIATELGGWLAQAGFSKAEDKVANTQAFVLLQAREALAILGSRALVSGTGISAKDLEFAKDIAAGNITQTEEALRRLISLNEKAHRLKAQDYNKVVDEYAKQYQRPDALGLKVELPPEYSKPQANAMEPPPVAIQALRKNPSLAAEFKRKYGLILLFT